MLGPLTVGKKAAKFGYRRFGKVGAVAFGAVAVGSYLVARRKFKSLMGQQTDEPGEESGDAAESDANAEQN